ncbi:MAG TPA: HAD family hydrolase [Streptosporangiaceae bacterium]|jgi:phosphonatase-like hydrolase
MTHWHWQLTVLDLAGTTIRDGGLVEQAVAAAVDAVEPGRTVTAQEFTASRGLPKSELFGALFAGRPADAGRALATFNDHLLTLAATGRVTEVPGAAQVIAELKAAGADVYLMSGFAEPVAAALLTHLGWQDAVDGVLTPGAAGRGRPYPDLILSAAVRAQVDDVHRIAVCGDTTNDLIAASRAGAGAAVGVLTGAHDRARLKTAPHTHLLTSIRELPTALQQAAPATAGTPE